MIMPRPTMSDIAKQKAKEIAEYLHANYEGQEVSKRSIILRFDMANNVSWLAFSILPKYNIEVKRINLVVHPQQQALTPS